MMFNLTFRNADITLLSTSSKALCLPGFKLLLCYAKFSFLLSLESIIGISALKMIQNVQRQISYVSQTNRRPRNKAFLSISALHGGGFNFWVALLDLR